MRNISIQLVEGVTGGFMPAIPRKTILIDLNPPTFKIVKYLKSNDAKAVDGYLEYTANPSLTKSVIETFCETNLALIKSLPVITTYKGRRAARRSRYLWIRYFDSIQRTWVSMG
jgi:hypothetical protein